MIKLYFISNKIGLEYFRKKLSKKTSMDIILQDSNILRDDLEFAWEKNGKFLSHMFVDIFSITKDVEFTIEVFPEYFLSWSNKYGKENTTTLTAKTFSKSLYGFTWIGFNSFFYKMKMSGSHRGGNNMFYVGEENYRRVGSCGFGRFLLFQKYKYISSTCTFLCTQTLLLIQRIFPTLWLERSNDTKKKVSTKRKEIERLEEKRKKLNESIFTTDMNEQSKSDLQSSISDITQSLNTLQNDILELQEEDEETFEKALSSFAFLGHSN